MELDRQGIERRDFPIVRRGYDPASVDSHLRALAAEVEQLEQEVSSRGRESLASTAGTHVQGILEAAQATAETIEREAAQDAQRVRTAADTDAKRTRDEAVARAQEHVAAVAKATEALLARVGTMESESQTLIESLRSGAGQLAGDLAAVGTNMGALYDAAAARGGGSVGGEQQDTTVDRDAEFGVGANGVPTGHTSIAALAAEQSIEAQAELPVDLTLEGQLSESWPEPEPEPEPESELELESAIGEETGFAHESNRTTPAAVSSEDADGARLVALNMALNGDSREETGQYLAENFDVPDCERLLDEVYAAIEG